MKAYRSTSPLIQVAYQEAATYLLPQCLMRL